MKKISPNIKLKIIELSSCFWYWKSFYIFYSSILGISVAQLEKKYPKNIYNKYSATESILDSIENDKEKLDEVVKAFFELEKPFEKDVNPKYQEAQIKLNEFKNLVEKYVKSTNYDNKLDKEKLERTREENSINLEKYKKLEDIKLKFYEKLEYTTLEKKKERGFWLEKVFYEILELENIDHSGSYRTKTEQIDGHLKFGSFDYLVEIKWTKDPIKQKDVNIFLGKIKNKAQSNRGFMLSISGFDQSAVDASKTDRNLIFMDVMDFISVVEQRSTFYDLMKTKEDILVKHGLPYKK